VMVLAERLRASIESQPIHVTGADEPLRCTVTIGVSSRFYGADGLEEALREADEALYRGKAGGRNRVEVGGSTPSLITPPPTMPLSDPATAVSPTR